MTLCHYLRIVAIAAFFTLAGCAEESAHNRGVYMLMDTSGTYTQELEKAQHIINYILAKLEPSDSFAVARIDTGSFSEKDIIARITFDSRPSKANQEKLAFRDTVGRFIKVVRSSAYTDITGGMLQATEYLDEKAPAKKTILIFSDLKEEIQKGFVRDIPLQLKGYEVVALNVTKLRSDNIDPREYMQRLDEWQKRVETGGGSWRVINDLERLEKILAD
jgi:hypothetical protein